MIYFDGDSHTYGEELENPAQESFPKILSEKLGHEFVNLAESGCGNDEIMRRVYRYLSQCKEKNQYPDMIVIGWTEVDRETWFVEGVGKSVDTYKLTATEAHKLYPERLSKFRKNVKYNGIYIAALTHYWYNQVYNLHCELELLKIPHLFFHGCPNWLKKWNDIRSWNIVKMDNITSYVWNNTFINQTDPNFSMFQWTTGRGHPHTEYDHVGPLAHVEWAELLYDHIQQHNLLDQS